MLIDPSIQIVHPDVPRGRFRVALFDFDGTLSLLRTGWEDVMVESIRCQLRALEADSAIDAVVDQIVVGLNGHPTIVQMQALADEIQRRGGQPNSAAEYADEYQRRLLAMIQGRYLDICTGRASASRWTVPGAQEFLSTLRSRGLQPVLISGTERHHVEHEANLLNLSQFFPKSIYAPVSGDSSFSKREVIQRLIQKYGLVGENVLGFGDGVVETEEVHRIGGVAVAVTTDRNARNRLIRAGADVVIRDYDCQVPLLHWLFAEV